MKYTIICCWSTFNYRQNLFTNIYCKSYEYTDNYEEASFVIIGSFINEPMYNVINNLKCTKILYITEPYKHMSPFLRILVDGNKFDYMTGSVSNSIKQIKYPLYLLYFNFTNKNIFLSANNYVKTCDIGSKKFCCLVNRHDRNNTRTDVYNKMLSINEIECPSQLFNNTTNEQLNELGKNDYLKQFKFIICPENSYIDGYITEKLLQSCLGGSIPIYYGCFDDVDAKIFNKGRILFYDSTPESIDKVYDKILQITSNDDEFKRFYKQDVFCDSAYETCMNMQINLLNFFDSLQITSNDDKFEKKL